ncbi:MAG: hypothetical protein ACLQU2_37465 [Candidatus Binataceae bacterium]
MGRDFEFKQLLRAYRNGIIDEATFEKEMAGLEGGSNGASTNGGGFRAMGKSYPSERAAIMSFLENGAAGEAGGAEAFTKWAEVCKTDCIRSGLRMLAEREAYHSRQLAQRLRELGGECRASMGEEGRKFISFVSNPDRSDVDKLQHLNKNFGDPGTIFKPAREFIASIKEDIETREMLRLFIEDECSTLTWLADSCKALSAPAQAVAATAAASTTME